MSENIKLQLVDPTILTNLFKTIQRLKSKLTDQELHLINRDVNRMNKYGANDLIRKVYQEARAKTHLNKQQRSSGNPKQNAEEEEPKEKERYVTRKEQILKGRLIQKGIKPTRSGLKFPNGRKYDVNYEDFVHDFGKNLKKKSYVLLQYKIRELLIILKQNTFPTSYIENKELKQLGSIRSSSSKTEDSKLPSTSS